MILVAQCCTYTLQARISVGPKVGKPKQGIQIVWSVAWTHDQKMPRKLVKFQVEMKSPGDTLAYATRSNSMMILSWQMHHVNSSETMIFTVRWLVVLHRIASLWELRQLRLYSANNQYKMCWFMGPSKHCIYKDYCAGLHMSCRDPWTSKNSKSSRYATSVTESFDRSPKPK